MGAHETILALGPSIPAGGRTLIIQVLLVLGNLAIIARPFAKRGAQQLAVRRLLVLAFAVFAVLTVMFPRVLTSIAHVVGVGRGADLLLYATVVVLLGSLALAEARTKNAEKRTTVLARRLALDEAEQPGDYRERLQAPRG